MKPIHLDARLKRVRASMRANALDALVVTRDGGYRYLAGTQVVWRSAVIVPAKGDPVLITPSWDVERAMASSWLSQSKTWHMTRPATFIEAIVGVLRDFGAPERVGVDFGTGAATGAITATEYLGLIEQLPEVTLVDGTAALDAVMVKKEPGEIELLRRAAEVADIGMEAAFDSARSGRTDLDLVGIAEAAMRTAGNEFTWSVTGTEIGSGRRQDFHHGVTSMPTLKAMQTGDMVTLDMHPMVDTYLADFCLNLVIGDPSPEQVSLASAWKSVFDHLMAGLRPGAVIGDLCREAESVAVERGVGDMVVPWFGHGLGTDARIPKVLTADNEASVEQGDVIVILVQVNHPGVGGMRVELPIVVEKEANTPLNKLPIGLYRTTHSGVELVEIGD